METESAEVVALLQASERVSDAFEKVQLLRQARFILLEKRPGLLQHFLQPLLSCAFSPSPEVRYFMAETIHQIAIASLKHMPSTLNTLLALLEDSHPFVAKRAIRCSTFILLAALRVIAKKADVSKKTAAVWEALTKLKLRVLTLTETAENTGVIMQALKFAEVLVLAFSFPSQRERQQSDNFTLADVPTPHPLLNTEGLTNEGRVGLLILLKHWRNPPPTCTSSSIIVAMTSLVSIVRQRESLAHEIIPALCDLGTSVPISFSTWMRNSVHHMLRTVFFLILKLPYGPNYVEQITAKLDAIGAKDFADHIRRVHETLKRKSSAATSEEGRASTIDEPYSKRRKDISRSSAAASSDNQAIMPTNFASASTSVSSSTPSTDSIQMGTALTMDLLAQLLIENMRNLPPPPISNDPLPAIDLPNLARLLVALLAVRTMHQGPAVGAPSAATAQPATAPTARLDATRDPRLAMLASQSSTATGGPSSTTISPALAATTKEEAAEKLGPSPTTADAIAFLAGVSSAPPPIAAIPATKEVIPRLETPMLSKEELMALSDDAFHRILGSEEAVVSGGGEQLRVMLLSRMASIRPREDPLLKVLISHIVNHLQKRIGLAVTWLYHEYINERREGKLLRAPYEGFTGRRFHSSPEQMEAAASAENAASLEASDNEISTPQSPSAAKNADQESMQEDEVPSKTRRQQEEEEEEEDKEKEDATGNLQQTASMNEEDEIVTDLNTSDASLVVIELKQEDAETEENESRYAYFLRLLLEAACEALAPKDFLVISQLYLAVPMLTSGAFCSLQAYCEDDDRLMVGLSTLRDLVQQRPQHLSRFCLYILLSYTINEKASVRSPAIDLVANELFVNTRWSPLIEDFAQYVLMKLTNEEWLSAQEASILTSVEKEGEPKKDVSDEHDEEEGNKTEDGQEQVMHTKKEKQENDRESELTTNDDETAPEEQMGSDKGTEESSSASDGPHVRAMEELIQRHLLLYFALCSKKHELLHTLVGMYCKTRHIQVKKVIHRHAKDLIPSIGMQSPALLQLITTFGAGAETFILQILHILTETAPPTPQLVDGVKTLYQTRVPDARFLIPVLSGLTKDEIVDLLPNFIALPPTILKNVIHRLLHNRPTNITPEELLVALHCLRNTTPASSLSAPTTPQQPPKKVPLRSVVEAIGYCLEQQTVYSQSIMAIVLQQLVDVIPTPPMFMRTVMQTLRRFPKLMGFIMGILLRLTSKQIWNDARLWQGFIKCCQMTQPHSYPILLQLPPPHLEDVLKKVPSLKQTLREYCLQNQLNYSRTILSLLDL
ncbi:Symplekin [Balamuthia mandrillaris]